MRVPSWSIWSSGDQFRWTMPGSEGRPVWTCGSTASPVERRRSSKGSSVRNGPIGSPNGVEHTPGPIRWSKGRRQFCQVVTGRDRPDGRSFVRRPRVRYLSQDCDKVSQSIRIFQGFKWEEARKMSRPSAHDATRKSPMFGSRG